MNYKFSDAYVCFISFKDYTATTNAKRSIFRHEYTQYQILEQ